ncbi:MAG: endonuclease/exonuclease/phosphatase family protein [Rhodobacteraceae bacterium]|nr:endonuclease/exonuclease/phosphatase family protein [Paracoccaceae bacterium]
MIRLLAVLWLLFLALPLHAQTPVRFATLNTGLGRDGPGVLLKDILDKDADIMALAGIITETAPDILLLTGFDTDFKNVALGAFNALSGLQYPYVYAPLGNGGLASGLDINNNGQMRDWNDNWGFGRFEGSEGMALLSRFPLSDARRFEQLKWQDFGPGPQNPDGTPFFPPEIWPQLRLASHSLWDIEVALPSGPVRLLAAHPTPPVFDGEEDANGLRNEAEAGFLLRYISGEAFRDDNGTIAALAEMPVIMLADLNADPQKGESRKTALRALLAHPRLQNVANAPTVDWAATGPMRVDYVLPDTALDVVASGVFWPPDSPLLAAADTRHRLVWVDVLRH